MLGRYWFQGTEIDSIDLKSLIVSRGVNVEDEVYRQFQIKFRINPNPVTCNCLILPDQTIAQLTDVPKHLKYLGETLFLGSPNQTMTSVERWKPLDLNVTESASAVLSFDGKEITTVGFPKRSDFYEQKTSSGLPFIGNASLQGADTVSFQSLWPCEIAREGNACQFCLSGGITEQLARFGNPEPKMPTARDVAEIVDFAVNGEMAADCIQLDGGYTKNSQTECHRMVEFLNEIDSSVGLDKIRDTLVFTSPPTDPEMLDQVFDAGADHVVFSPGVWDEKLASIITPGQIKHLPRKRYMDALKYVAMEYGPNRACSVFIIGVEPVESFLSGAEALAKDGIVAMASLWIPFGRAVMASEKPPNVDYYRKVKVGLAEIYDKYGIVPPSASFNTHIDYDIWHHKYELLPLTASIDRN